MRSAVALLCFFACSAFAAGDILIVADEFPAMENFAAQLKTRAGMGAKIVAQTDMPADLTPFPTVAVYIHKSIAEATEMALLKYARAGGRLLLIHHSISSGKRPNKEWLPSFEIQLPTGDKASGGYHYYEGITMQLVNLNPKDYIVSNKVKFPEKADWKGEPRPALTLHETEVYLNQVFTGPRTLLLGIRYEDAKTGKVWTQDTGGWYRPLGKGWVVYFMAGHSAKDFNNEVYAQILSNAVTAKLRP